MMILTSTLPKTDLTLMVQVSKHKSRTFIRISISSQVKMQNFLLLRKINNNL